MITASLARSVRLWDIRKLPTSYDSHHHEQVKEPTCHSCLHDYAHPLSVNSAFFNQTGELFVTLCQDNHLRVYPLTVDAEAKEHCVSIRHRSQTGKWLTKIMPEWHLPLGGPFPDTESDMKGPYYFYCGSMNEERQISVVVLFLFTIAIFCIFT